MACTNLDDLIQFYVSIKSDNTIRITGGYTFLSFTFSYAKGYENKIHYAIFTAVFFIV